MSAARRHEVPLERSEPKVENASVDAFPTKLWSCDAPGWPGKTIGSSGARWLKAQLSTWAASSLERVAGSCASPSGETGSYAGRP